MATKLADKTFGMTYGALALSHMRHEGARCVLESFQQITGEDLHEVAHGVHVPTNVIIFVAYHVDTRAQNAE